MTDLSDSLLKWYDRHRRRMPWRALPGETPNPYHVWLSEIMLQQTTVATVKSYFEHFLSRWPTIDGLAEAELDEVLHAWQGLGYYARARNLHKCAAAVVAGHGGEFPRDEASLLKLPGIGPYTAAAIAAIAFDQMATPVDGNVERVMARLNNVVDPMPGSKPKLKALAAKLTPSKRNADYAQAVMDLGATICTPKKPACSLCPWSADCLGFKSGSPERLPKRQPKANRPTRKGVVFWAIDKQGRVLIRRRPEKGLLGGMMEFPSTNWLEDGVTDDEALSLAPVKADWRKASDTVQHTFTHLHLELSVFIGRGVNDKGDGIWCAVQDLDDHALPTLMKKVARLVRTQEGA